MYYVIKRFVTCRYVRDLLPCSPRFNRGCRQQYWAAGTGYGHSGAAGEKWDVEAYLAAQREQDRLKEDLLQV